MKTIDMTTISIGLSSWVGTVGEILTVDATQFGLELWHIRENATSKTLRFVRGWDTVPDSCRYITSFRVDEFSLIHVFEEMAKKTGGANDE